MIKRKSLKHPKGKITCFILKNKDKDNIKFSLWRGKREYSNTKTSKGL